MIKLYADFRNGDIKIYSPLGEKTIKVVDYQVRYSLADFKSLQVIDSISAKKPVALIELEKELKAEKEIRVPRSRRLEVNNGTDS